MKITNMKHCSLTLLQLINFLYIYYTKYSEINYTSILNITKNISQTLLAN